MTTVTDDFARWCAELDGLEAAGPVLPVEALTPREAATRLVALGAPEVDAALVTRSIPTPGGNPEGWRLLRLSHHRLMHDLGQDERTTDGTGPWGAWPPLAERFGEAGRHFLAHLYVLALPTIEAWYRAHAIEPQVFAATFANLGRNIGLHRSKRGEPGLDAAWWLVLHFRGLLFELGRLQHVRGPWPWSARAAERAGAPAGPGDPVLDLHVPPTGALTPEAVDESFGLARRFFARHFAHQASEVGVCDSWLLDPQLAEWLPADSNIVRFQRRFRLVPDDPPRDGTAAVLEFVFHRIVPRDIGGDDLEQVLAGLPQRTQLERAVVAHLRAGGRWHARRGWCRLG